MGNLCTVTFLISEPKDAGPLPNRLIQARFTTAPVSVQGAIWQTNENVWSAKRTGADGTLSLALPRPSSCTPSTAPYTASIVSGIGSSPAATGAIVLSGVTAPPIIGSAVGFTGGGGIAGGPWTVASWDPITTTMGLTGGAVTYTTIPTGISYIGDIQMQIMLPDGFSYAGVIPELDTIDFYTLVNDATYGWSIVASTELGIEAVVSTVPAGGIIGRLGHSQMPTDTAYLDAAQGFTASQTFQPPSGIPMISDAANNTSSMLLAPNTGVGPPTNAVSRVLGELFIDSAGVIWSCVVPGVGISASWQPLNGTGTVWTGAALSGVSIKNTENKGAVLAQGDVLVSTTAAVTNTSTATGADYQIPVGTTGLFAGGHTSGFRFTAANASIGSVGVQLKLLQVAISSRDSGGFGQGTYQVQVATLPSWLVDGAKIMLTALNSDGTMGGTAPFEYVTVNGAPTGTGPYTVTIAGGSAFGGVIQSAGHTVIQQGWCVQGSALGLTLWPDDGTGTKPDTSGPRLAISSNQIYQLGLTASYAPYYFGMNYSLLVPGNNYWVVFEQFLGSVDVGETTNAYAQSSSAGNLTATYTQPSGPWVNGSGTLWYTIYGQTPIATNTHSDGSYGIFATSRTQPSVIGQSTHYASGVFSGVQSPGLVASSHYDIGVNGTSLYSAAIYGLAGGNIGAAIGVVAGSTFSSQLMLQPHGTGKPTTNYHLPGEIWLDSLGDIYVCREAGRPGMWGKLAWGATAQGGLGGGDATLDSLVATAGHPSSGTCTAIPASGTSSVIPLAAAPTFNPQVGQIATFSALAPSGSTITETQTCNSPPASGTTNLLLITAPSIPPTVGQTVTVSASGVVFTGRYTVLAWDGTSNILTLSGNVGYIASATPASISVSWQPTYTVTGFNLSTSVTAPSNGVDTSAFAGSGVLHVGSTAGFPGSGTIYVATAGTTAVITYTGTTPDTVTGCTTSSGGGVMSTGGTVSFSTAANYLLLSTNFTYTGSPTSMTVNWGPLLRSLTTYGDVQVGGNLFLGSKFGLFVDTGIFEDLVDPPASATQALLQLGAGSFTGSSSGTFIGGNTTGSADFLRFSKNGVTQFRADNSGNVTAGSGAFQTGADATVALSLQGHSTTQSADLWQIKDSAGNIRARVTSNYHLEMPLTGEIAPTPSLTANALPNSGAWVADPTTVPTVAKSGTGGSFGQAGAAATVLVSYAWATQAWSASSTPAITAATVSAGTVTITFGATGHNLNVGQKIVVQGFDSGYNGTFTITATTTTSIAYSASPGGNSVAMGTVLGGISQLSPPAQYTFVGTTDGLALTSPAFPANVNAVLFYISSASGYTANLPAGYTLLTTFTTRPNPSSAVNSQISGSAPVSNQTGTAAETQYPSVSAAAGNPFNDDHGVISVNTATTGTMTTGSQIVLTFGVPYSGNTVVGFWQAGGGTTQFQTYAAGSTSTNIQLGCNTALTANKTGITWQYNVRVG